MSYLTNVRRGNIVVAITFVIFAAVLGYTAPHSHTVQVDATDVMFCAGDGYADGTDKGPTDVRLVIVSDEHHYLAEADAKVVLELKNGTWAKYESMCKNWSNIQEEIEK